MISPRCKKRLENLRRIATFYKNLAALHEGDDPIVKTAMNRKATIVYYNIFKEYERDEQLIHDSFADVYGHTGEILYYRRQQGNEEKEYFFKDNAMPPRFMYEIDNYISEVLQMLDLPSNY